jgi:Glycosyl hydrolase family 12
MSSKSSRLTMWARILFVPLFVFVVASAVVVNAKVAKAAQVCSNGQTIAQNPYWLSNNLWGASTGSGSQCISNTSQNGSTIAWSTSWNWTGQANSVKSYDSSVLGWHWGWMFSNTGLPIQLSSNQSVQTSWSFNLNQTTAGGIDVSYDTWISPNASLGNANPSDEVMVWLYHGGGIQPAGSSQTTVNIDGMSWTLWEGSGSWQIHSFVLNSNATSASLNLMDFYQYLIQSGRLSSSKYLLSVEQGTEVFTGAGTLNTTAYSTTIGGSVSNPTPTPTPTRGVTPTPTQGTTPTPTPTRGAYRYDGTW